MGKGKSYSKVGFSSLVNSSTVRLTEKALPLIERKGPRLASLLQIKLESSGLRYLITEVKKVILSKRCTRAK